MEYYELVAAELSELSNFFITFSIELSSRFVEPLAALDKDTAPKYTKLVGSLETTLREGEEARRRLLERQGDFYQLSKLGEESEKSLLLFVTEKEAGRISAEDLALQSEKTTQFKVCTAEARVGYEQAVEAMNMHWNRLFTNFIPFVGAINKSEQRKRATIQAKIDQFVDLLRGCFVGRDLKSAGDLRENEAVFLDKLEAHLKEASTSLHNRVLSGAHISNFLNPADKPNEAVLPYADFLKIQEAILRHTEVLDKKETSTLTTLCKELFIDGAKEFAGPPAPDAAFERLFTKDTAVYKFLTDAQNQLASKDFFCTLHLSKFETLEHVFRAILNGRPKDWLVKDPARLKVVDVVLQIMNRVRAEDAHKKTLTLASRFKNLFFLKSIDLWYALFEFLVEMRSDNDLRRQKQKKSVFNQFFSGISNMVTSEVSEDQKEIIVA